METRPSDAFTNDRQYVFHSWSAQGALNPVVVAGAEGSWFWDDNGKRFLDFSSQLVNVNIGHQHPKLVAAIQEHAGKLCTVAPFHANDARSEAARLIVEAANADQDYDLSMVFFTNGGAEAAENAIRMARLHTVTRCSPPTAATTAPPPGPSRSPAIRAAGRASRASPAR